MNGPHFKHFAGNSVRPDWMDRGTCYVEEADPQIFYVQSPKDQEVAFAYCERCPVRQDCLEFALATTTSSRDHGIWGGTSERTRRRIRKDRRKLALVT